MACMIDVVQDPCGPVGRQMNQRTVGYFRHACIVVLDPEKWWETTVIVCVYCIFSGLSYFSVDPSSRYLESRAFHVHTNQ